MAIPKPERFPVAIIIIELDNLVLDNYWRKYYTYMELGWESNAIHEFIAQKTNKLQVS